MQALELSFVVCRQIGDDEGSNTKHKCEHWEFSEMNSLPNLSYAALHKTNRASDILLQRHTPTLSRWAYIALTPQPDHRNSVVHEQAVAAFQALLRRHP